MHAVLVAMLGLDLSSASQGTLYPPATTSSPQTPAHLAVDSTLTENSGPDRTQAAEADTTLSADSRVVIPSRRGVTRPRSDSDEETDDRPPRQRQRQSTATTSSLPTSHPSRPTFTAGAAASSSGELLSPTRLALLESTAPHRSTPSHARAATSTSPTVTPMGPPMMSGATNGSNGISTSNNGAGPSRNGHGGGPLGTTGTFRHINEVERVQPAGTMMYEDDWNWAQQMQERDMVIDDAEDSADKRGRSSGYGAKRMPVDREEVVRLILQGLRDIGYSQSADVLEAESGYVLASDAAIALEAAVRGGRWAEVLAILPEMDIEIEESASSASDPPASSASSIKSSAIPPSNGPPTDGERIRFLIAEQKYLEYLETSQSKKALHTLRTELAPVIKDPEVLHTLSQHMIAMNKEDLYERAGWDGAAGSSRRSLLARLQEYISPKVMVPNRRLATLLDQARQFQAANCPYHQDYEAISLYNDHDCKPGIFPNSTTHILADHGDEVWRIEWSPDGLMLASGGKDKQVVIWKLEYLPEPEGGLYRIKPIHHLKDHLTAVDILSWSPDGKLLVTAADRSLYLWDTETGKQRRPPNQPSLHHDQISAVQWKSDGSQFIVSSLDCKMIFYTPEFEVARQWSFQPLQVCDFVITPDSSHIVAVTTSLKRTALNNKLKPSMSARPEDSYVNPSSSNPHMNAYGGVNMDDFAYSSMEHALMLIRMSDKEIIHHSPDLRGEISSIKLSWDGKRVLISCNPDEVQIWSIEPMLRFIRSFKGHIHHRYLIRSCFGGLKDRFVLSGSEDGHVYVWQANSNQAIHVLAGHDATVNAIAWNPDHARRMFASCSDDGRIRIWQAPEEPDPAIEMHDRQVEEKPVFL